MEGFDQKRDFWEPLKRILIKAEDESLTAEQAKDLLNHLSYLRGYPNRSGVMLISDVIFEIRSKLDYVDNDFFFAMEQVIDPQKRTDFSTAKENYILIERLLFQPFSPIPHLILRLLERSCEGKFKAKMGVGELQFIKVK
jgi:hypothetical protein